MKVTKTISGEKIDKKQFKKWIEALRSGAYSQTRGTLQDKEGHCCLGVACELFIPEGSKFRGIGNYLYGILPSDQPKVPRWLCALNRDSMLRLNGTGLTSLNDNMKMNFNEIADILELVYVHGALEEK